MTILQGTKGMAANFKCKQCKKRFPFSWGKVGIETVIGRCETKNCQLQHKNLSFLPVKSTIVIPEDTINSTPANDEKVTEVFEEQPIGGLLQRRDLSKKHGW
jgi:hypothetical protein